jgi:hypothetical protein
MARAGRGPPQAARRAGLELVEHFLTPAGAALTYRGTILSILDIVSAPSHKPGVLVLAAGGAGRHHDGDDAVWWLLRRSRLTSFGGRRPARPADSAVV